jgi:two-component system, response regulator YesN
LNILLVDDEIIVIKILTEKIDWNEIGIDRVFSAYNSPEAKKILTRCIRRISDTHFLPY